jgi:hypothetical protein
MIVTHEKGDGPNNRLLKETKERERERDGRHGNVLIHPNAFTNFSIALSQNVITYVCDLPIVVV